MAFLGQEEQVRELQDRFRYLYAAIFISLGIIVTRLIYLQVLNGDRLRRVAEENRIKRVKIAAPRGMIFDRERKILIDNRPAFDLEIVPQYLAESKQSGEVIDRLSRIIRSSPADIRSTLEKAKSQPAYVPVKIKTDLSRDEIAEVESWKLDMPGVGVAMEIKRTNVFGDVASHLLGYISEVDQKELPGLNKNGRRYSLGDRTGKTGLERRMEDILRGKDGEELVEVDAFGRRKLAGKKGRVLENVQGTKDVPGRNLILTLDQDLQLAASKAFGDKIGSLVAIDPRNGEVLAMVSRPSFDATEFSRGIDPDLYNRLKNDEFKPLLNRAFMAAYPPGSTFKLVTAITALEEGIIDENTRFRCSGSLKVGNRTVHCWRKEGHGEMGIVSAITQSCDVFFYRVAQKLKSVDDLAKWAFHMGLGKTTGFSLPGEKPGLIPTEEWAQKRRGIPWVTGETVSVAIGQGPLLLTTLQLANMLSAVANGGILYRPYLVSSIESFEGESIKTFEPEVISRPRLSAKTSELIRQGLWGVVNAPRGTAVLQRLPGMDFVGKTGTSQVKRFDADKIFQKCPSLKFSDRHHGIFVGFAPAKEPRIAVAVIAEHACSGSGGAAPIAREVVRTYMAKLDPKLYGAKGSLSSAGPGAGAGGGDEEDVLTDGSGAVKEPGGGSASEEEP